MAGEPRPVFKHPAALHDLLASGTGFLDYLAINRRFHHQFGPEYGLAAAYIKQWLPKVPILDHGKTGVAALGQADSQQIANRIARLLMSAQQSEMNLGYKLNRAGRLYVQYYGSPEQRKKAPNMRGFNPDA